MKLKLFLLFASLFVVQTALAQKAVITSKKVTYKRLKPSADYKKTFTVNFPKVKMANAALAKKIENVIGYERNLRLGLQEEIKGDIQWLEEADYDVVYNDRGVLCVNLFVTGSGAYPSSENKTVVVDLQTGRPVKPTDVFTNLRALIEKIKQLQQEDIKAGIKVIREDPDFADEDTNELFKNVDFKAANLEGFAVDDKGVAFVYDYGFPHVIQALEPDGNFYLDWKQMKPFIKKGSLFAQFVR